MRRQWALTLAEWEVFAESARRSRCDCRVSTIPTIGPEARAQKLCVGRRFVEGFGRSACCTWRIPTGQESREPRGSPGRHDRCLRSTRPVGASSLWVGRTNFSFLES